MKSEQSIVHDVWRRDKQIEPQSTFLENKQDIVTFLLENHKLVRPTSSANRRNQFTWNKEYLIGVVDKMSVSSPEISLSSSSTSSKEDVDYWEINPQPPPSQVSRLSSMDCWDYSIELECLKGPEGCYCHVLLLLLISLAVTISSIELLFSLFICLSWKSYFYFHLWIFSSSPFRINWKSLA